MADKNESQKNVLNKPKKTEVKKINFEETLKNSTKSQNESSLFEVEALPVTVNELVESHNKTISFSITLTNKCVNLVPTKMLKVVLIVSFANHQNIYNSAAYRGYQITFCALFVCGHSFFSIRVYLGLHFLPIILRNYFFVILCLICFLFVLTFEFDVILWNYEV